jgi:hypothetical protein
VVNKGKSKNEERTTVTFTDKTTEDVKEVVTVKDLTTGKVDKTDITTSKDGTKT